jgi:hypothetical protein
LARFCSGSKVSGFCGGGDAAGAAYEAVANVALQSKIEHSSRA